MCTRSLARERIDCKAKDSKNTRAARTDYIRSLSKANVLYVEKLSRKSMAATLMYKCALHCGGVCARALATNASHESTFPSNYTYISTRAPVCVCVCMYTYKCVCMYVGSRRNQPYATLDPQRRRRRQSRERANFADNLKRAEVSTSTCARANAEEDLYK